MKILYIFPHPDDESFGPALAISSQVKAGDGVFLLTLTRGEATKQRHRLGLSLEEMGEVRFREMLKVKEVLQLEGMTVLDHPDGQLSHLDPRVLEADISRHIRKIQPDVVVTYAVHGVSGFHDHLVTHAVVKRVFCQLRDEMTANAPRRLALFTMAESDHPEELVKLSTSPAREIDVAIPVADDDVARAQEALDAYETYQDVIEKADPLGRTGRTVYFELFGETFDPPLDAMTRGL